MNSIQSVELDELKNFQKVFQKPAQSWEIAEVFFLRLRLHLMRQSELKVRANKQFLLVDNDAKRIGGRFLNLSTVVQSAPNAS